MSLSKLPPDETQKPRTPTFEEELTTLLNKHSQESVSSTPDFILARYLTACLEAYNATQVRRQDWFSSVDHTFGVAKGVVEGSTKTVQ